MGIFKNNIVIAFLALIAVSAFGAFYLMREPEDDGLLSVEMAGGAGVSSELLTTLIELKSLRFNTSVLESPALNTLKDFSREIPQEPKGRPNPFAPVGSDRETLPVSTSSPAQ